MFIKLLKFKLSLKEPTIIFLSTKDLGYKFSLFMFRFLYDIFKQQTFKRLYNIPIFLWGNMVLKHFLLTNGISDSSCRSEAVLRILESVTKTP